MSIYKDLIASAAQMRRTFLAVRLEHVHPLPTMTITFKMREDREAFKLAMQADPEAMNQTPLQFDRFSNNTFTIYSIPYKLKVKGE